MANNNIQVTHENIHTGLSGLNNDEKWKDMLNFRSAQSRTTVVPHKFLVATPFCAHLHTIIAALNGHNLAVGANKSFGFVGADNICAYPLWRLKQRYLGELGDRDSQSQRLLVQGSYTGQHPLRLRVSYIAGRLVPFWAVPPAPEAVTPAPEIDYGCGENLAVFKVYGTFTNSVTTEPLADVLVEFILFGHIQYTLRTNSLGKFEIPEFLPGFYTFRYTIEGYITEPESFEITEETELNRALVDSSLPEPIECSTSAESGGEGYELFLINLGTELGTVTLEYHAIGIPDRFVVKHGGVTVIDTGYVGNSSYNADLALLGLGPVTGPGSGSASFVKTTTTPTATVEVYGPLEYTAWSFTLSCPEP
jgi:hypothetical protein